MVVVDSLVEHWEMRLHHKGGVVCVRGTGLSIMHLNVSDPGQPINAARRIGQCDAHVVEAEAEAGLV